MELYEVIYDIPASEIEVGDLIKFNWIDIDEEPYEEIVHVSDVDYEGKYVIVTGYSEVLNDTDEYHVYEETEVGVLGG